MANHTNITPTKYTFNIYTVAPYAGAWIETFAAETQKIIDSVAPYAGTTVLQHDIIPLAP